MKKLVYQLACLAFVANANAQSVGIGTTAPNSNVVLDIVSTNKGVLIPRILDTATVSNPMEGLIIYNKTTKSPYYYNGSQWLSLGGRLPSTLGGTTDKITYQISGNGFSNTEEIVYSLSQGVSNPTNISAGGLTSGVANLSSFNFMKESDINSVNLNMASVMGTKSASIEIKLYASGSLIPYISYRFKNIIFESYQASGSAGGGPLIESVSVAFENYGFKDWVNNIEFGYNLTSRTITSY